MPDPEIVEVGILLHEELDSWGVFLQCRAVRKDHGWELRPMYGHRVENLDEAQPRHLACWNDMGASELIEAVLAENFNLDMAEQMMPLVKQHCIALGKPLYERKVSTD